MNNTNQSISIIGLGPMGQAMAKAYLSKGYKVTVWNRTSSKAKELIALGARLAETTLEAVQANDLLILSLTDYHVMYTVLESATKAFTGKTIVNMSSDAPENVRKAVRWANGFGANFISGGIMVPPPLVGQEGDHVYTFYSGARQVFDQYQPVLQVMTRTDYLGEDPGLAMLYYQAQLDFMYTSVAGALHAFALIKSAGIPAKAFEPYFNNFLSFLPDLFLQANTAEEIDKRQYKGDENNMFMLKAGMDHVVQASSDAGINVTLPNTVNQIFEATVAKGFGKDGINSIFEVLQKQS